ncbi:MerR family transcriptional regulator [Phreatobacter aquaticus]|uniref:MerR family transcriptional regulator n=1 Tax=Phreatobacter aquaticus TaxID=2570229 RepID=A0A4D7QI28_9HYPH|nr:MerR family transcriptional regulator [Phreatobacter aquaticus]QCK86575.1 MerR family transcriptional regulator [Phreatobacter aquaticus]
MTSTSRGTINMSGLSKATGVHASTLRSWETRYGLVAPARSAGGHRLYSQDDVERLMVVKELADAGFRLPELAGLSLDELRALRASPVRPDQQQLENPLVLQLERAVDERDPEAFGQYLRFAFLSLPANAAVDLYSRSMRHIGRRWSEGVIGVGMEHRLSARAREAITGAIAGLAPAGRREPIAFATLTEELHELGLLAGAYLAAAAGHKVIYFGANMPADDLAASTVSAGARLLVLSFVFGSARDQFAERLGELMAALPDSIPVWLGASPAALGGIALPPTVTLVHDFAEFNRRLKIQFTE